MATGPNWFAGWENAVLHALGIPVTPQNITYLAEWHNKDVSGNNPPALNNPLNVTAYPAVPVTVGSGSINSVGVQSYGTPAQGTAATAAYLNMPNFAPIKAALASGDPYSYAASNPSVSAALSKWSGGGYASIPKPGTGGGLTGTLANVGKSALDVATLGSSGEVLGGGYIPKVSSVAGDVAGAATGAVSSAASGAFSGLTSWIQGEAAVGLAYVMFTLIGVVLVVVGALEVFGYSPGKLLRGPLAGSPGSSKLAQGETIPY